MTIIRDSGTPEDRSSAAAVGASTETNPNWVPGTALPSSELLLASFAGVRQLHGSDILDAAVDLVACQRQFREALVMLADEQIGHSDLKHAAAELVSAREDSEILTAVIDDAVDHRQLQRAIAPPSAPPPVPITGVPEGTSVMVVQTESVGALVARMADLWVLVLAAVATDEEPLEATRLAQLCQGYDCLAAAIESGQQLVLGR
ncbi:hypothetical protein [Nocardia vinacea]|uniref:hypothetical protein n=1 Tax=Nocardia vinacea TaxID=96468 RepID=UPI0002FE3BEE|nr:hypothetical protein [Nocardia vinacea]